MAAEALIFPDPPSLTNGDDGVSYSMGERFSLTPGETGSCVGVRWRVPDAAPSPAGGSHVVSVWLSSGPTRLASKVFTPAAGGYQDVFFDTPFDVGSGVDYVAAVFTRGYVFKANPGGTGDLLSPSGKIHGDQANLTETNNPDTYPSSSFPAYYFVSPLVDFDGTPEDHTTTGTASVAVTAESASGASKTSAATAEVFATAESVTRTTRTKAATVVLSATARAVVATVRATAGRAALVVTAHRFAAAAGPGPRILDRRAPARVTESTTPGRIVSVTTSAD